MQDKALQKKTKAPFRDMKLGLHDCRWDIDKLSFIFAQNLNEFLLLQVVDCES